jgi:hypothetical protein
MRPRSLMLLGTASTLCLALVLVPTARAAGAPTVYSPGAAGVGDPYYPLYGNGGYDVGHYKLQLSYDPATDRLVGEATVSATATQNLSRFNLDLQGLTVRSVRVDGDRATWQRSDDHELVVTPRNPLDDGDGFTAVIRYDGVPRTQSAFGLSAGFIHTDDGAVIAGEPEVAANWYPVNDHPTDKASYTFVVTVPAGLEVVANGTLTGHTTARGSDTWTWDAPEPMASYLATATIGDFLVHDYQADGRQMYDAVDPDLYDPTVQPHTGDYDVASLRGNSTYKRLSRTLSVPAAGSSLSFWVARDTEPNWDYVFVEARTPGLDDWTTLPDLNEHTSQDTGFSCPFGGWQAIHPHLAHYQTAAADGCTPVGTTGEWWAATGSSGGWEEWVVDLSGWAGGDVEVSLAYASDEVVQGEGVFVDDVVSSTGAGSTSFEEDADPFDGWAPSPPPPGSPTGTNFVRTTVEGVSGTVGDVADGSFARQPEILAFLSEQFGPYPFESGGGIVDDTADLSFALENQTRPIYAKGFFDEPVNGDFVVVHENAHQWYGDSVAVARWKDIWLNEGFATYAEWLWSEREGFGTAQDNFDFFYEVIPADDPFWSVVIGDPGVDLLFDFAVYARGAMTLHELRKRVGTQDFFEILRTWAADKAGGNGTTEEFIALSEQISGKKLDRLFDTWLFTAGKPAAGAGGSQGGGPQAATVQLSAGSALQLAFRDAPAAARSLAARLLQ